MIGKGKCLFCLFNGGNRFPIDIYKNMKSRVSEVNDINELYKCWFHSILSICMFIYTVLLTSSLHCALSTGGKWQDFILENYFFNPHFSGRSRRNIWSNVITCCFYDDPAPLLLVKALTVF